MAVTSEKVEAASKQMIEVSVNGAHFMVAPTRAALVLKAFGRAVGHNTKWKSGYTEWLTLNDKYQLFVHNLNKNDFCKGAGMNTYDVAVPEDWLRRPENLKKWKAGEWAVWGYDGKDARFGRPVWRTEIILNLKRNILAALRR